MNESTDTSERRSLVASAVANVVVGCAAVVVYVLSGSGAILLDGLFNLTYFATGLFTLKVARLVTLPDDPRFPMGYSFFEPLVNGLKGVLVLGVTVFALVDAASALLAGGRPIQAGMAVAYGAFAAAVCWALAFVMRAGARRSASPLVAADAENWMVNAAISTCVLLGFVGVYLVEGTSLTRFTPYFDPLLVLAVGVLSISIPVRMAWRALMELLMRAAAPDVVRDVTSIVESGLVPLPVRSSVVRVVQPGRSRLVLVHVVLPADHRVELPALDGLRGALLESLRALHRNTFLEVVFTADERWADGSI